MVHSDKVTSQSSVIFARFQTSEPLAEAKLAKVANHVHDLAFASQVAARVLQNGDVVHKYLADMGVLDASGNTVVAAAEDGGRYDAAKKMSDKRDTTVPNGLAVDAAQGKAEQISWANASADLSGVHQGRHCLKMEDFLNIFYPCDTEVSNDNNATHHLPKSSIDQLKKAKLFDQNNASVTGRKGFFEVDVADIVSNQKSNYNDTDTQKEAYPVVLTPLGSRQKDNAGFNVQTEVMTNILKDLGIDVEAEEAKGAALDALDSVSYIKLANYLGKHDNLGAIVDDCKLSSNEQMDRGKLFLELARQYDNANNVHRDTKTSDDTKPLTKSVKTDVAKESVPGDAAAQLTLENAFTDKSAHESGRVAVAFLYKSQTQGVRDTEVRVHMKLSGGKNTATVTFGTQPLAVNAKIGRTWDQTCTVLPMMNCGKPVNVD